MSELEILEDIDQDAKDEAARRWEQWSKTPEGRAFNRLVARVDWSVGTDTTPDGLAALISEEIAEEERR